ncbi:MAG: HAD family phosphatase [Candidatus Magasanikbacteria bacterium]|nr:HAD family phosphatase [Candidatus Magasanikbacteria bacterium]
MLKAVLFDMDGVLVDSELYWPQYEEKLFSDLGINFTDEFKKEILGLNLVDIGKIIRSKYSYALSQEELENAYEKISIDVYKSSNLLSGVKSFLDELQTHGTTLAIVSSSPMHWINLCLSLKDISTYFPMNFSARDYNMPGKPKPDIYLEAMKQLGVSPEETIIFEDSQNGYRSAIASGAKVVVVTDPRWCSGDYSRANFQVENFEELDLKLIETLFK